MKRSKIILVFTAFLAVAAICLSVFAAAETSKTVQLVTLDYIDNTLLPLVDQKIADGSVKAMQETVSALQGAIDYLNTELSAGKSTDAALQNELSALDASLASLTQKVNELVGVKADIDELAKGIIDLSARYSDLEKRIAALEAQTPVLPAGFEKITLSEGSVLAFSDGVAEIVLLSGALSVTCEKGVTDLTMGSSVSVNESVPPSHHLIVVTDGGDGFLALSEETTIRVKGEYEIVKQ